LENLSKQSVNSLAFRGILHFSRKSGEPLERHELAIHNESGKYTQGVCGFVEGLLFAFVVAGYSCRILILDSFSTIISIDIANVL
jgi:hypothetical protein